MTMEFVGFCCVMKVQLRIAEAPMGFRLQIMDLKADPCSLVPLFSMRALITESTHVETCHRIRVSPSEVDNDGHVYRLQSAD